MSVLSLSFSGIRTVMYFSVMSPSAAHLDVGGDELELSRILV